MSLKIYKEFDGTHIHPSDSGSLTWSGNCTMYGNQTIIGNITQTGTLTTSAKVINSYRVGTAHASAVCTEYGDGLTHETRLIFTNLPIVVTGAGVGAFGALIYTFPVYNIVVTGGSCVGTLSADAGGLLNASTFPRAGVGTTIGAGGVANLTGTPDFHNICEDRANLGADLTVPVNVLTPGSPVDVTGSGSLLSTAPPRAFFNIASANWAAAASALFSGTITIFWSVSSE